MLTIKLPGKSWLGAITVSVVLGVYLLSADISTMSNVQKKPLPMLKASENPTPLSTVNARRFEQVTIPRTLTLYGRTTPDRIITVSAELAARITAISTSRGSLVRAGQELIQLEQGNLPAQLKSAQARVKKANLDLKSARSLQKKNLIADNQIPQLEVALAESKSELQRLQIDLANTRIVSPVEGVLNERTVELGDYIDQGKPVAEILDLNPLIVTVDVPQQIVQNLKMSDSANVRLMGEQPADATIRYISRKADDATRTFKVELALPNPDMKVPAGLSVEADLLMGRVKAIEVSPALLSLDEEGVPGIKWVAPDNQVRFTAADIVKATSNSLWLSGIPDNARIITRGQGFVKEGSQVLVANKDSVLLVEEQASKEWPSENR